jgi:peptidoglycan/LPS O-acetylase OafA/YrhL
LAGDKLIVLSETAEPVRNNFDAIRLAMALLVVWSHSFAIHLGTEDSEWLSLLFGGVYNAGNLAVMAFFVISGFLITQSYVRSRSVASYFEKRVRRIYPGYLVATTISAFLFVAFIPHREAARPLSFLKAAAFNLLLRSYSPVADMTGRHDGALFAVNGALWSIPFEFWCYIGVAVLGAAALATNRRILLGLLISVMLAHEFLDWLGLKPGLGVVGDIFGWPYLWTKILPSFLLGMVAYAYRATLPRSGILLAALGIASVVACHLDEGLGFLLVSPSLAYGVFYVAFNDRLPLHNAARFGDFSYGVYLYGFAIQRLLQYTIARGWNLAEFFVASASLALIAGALSWHVVERQFMPRRTGVLSTSWPISLSSLFLRSSARARQ